MFKKLTIHNFQSHRDTTIDFCPGVNVITGRSQAGKTAILRALQWVISNRPRGFRFHSYFAGKLPTKVSLTLQDGTTVALEKTEKGAVYSLDSHLSAQEFKGFSDKVPDAVEQAINLSDINVQSQLEEPFLVLSSPGEIARTINRITRLEKVDEWTRQLTSRINRINHEVELLSDEAAKLGNKLKKYEGLDQLESLIDRCASLDEQIVFLQAQHDELEELKSSFKEVEQCIEVLEGLAEIEGLFDEAVAIEEEVCQYKDLKAQLSRLALLDGIIAQSAGIVSEAGANLRELEDLELRLKESKRFKDELGLLDDLEWNLSEASQKCEEIKEEYIKVLQELGKCPFCFSDISRDRIGDLLEVME